METKHTYFIEHKVFGKWLTFDGELTDNPDNPWILKFEEDWLAEDYLKPQSPTITSDFSGQHVHYNYSFVIMHEQLVEQIAEKNDGVNLYTDFIVTKHNA